MRLAFREPEATYITVNLGEIYIPEEIKEKSYGLDGELSEVLRKLAAERIALSSSSKRLQKDKKIR